MILWKYGNENDYILYRNDIKDFKQFIKKLHDIKKDTKRLHKCSFLESFNNRNNYIYYYFFIIFLMLFYIKYSKC